MPNPYGAKFVYLLAFAVSNLNIDLSPSGGFIRRTFLTDLLLNKDFKTILIDSFSFSEILSKDSTSIISLFIIF